MRVLDPILIAAALVLVPTISWWAGRFTGRRNMPVVTTILAGAIAALLTLAAKSAVIASFDGGDFGTALQRRFADTVASAEFVAFLVVFGVFMAMLAWSATPATFGADDRRRT